VHLRAAAVLALVLGTLGAGCAAHSTPSHNRMGVRLGLTLFPASARRPVAPLSATTLNGTQFRLRAQRGHVVVLNVWASWCTECRTESPLLARMAHRLRADGVRFVGIDERDDASAGRRFAARSGATYPEVFDPSGSALARFPQLPQMGIPSTLVIDPRGRAAARIIGAAHAGELRRAVAEAARNG
jgi:thiol-disulfide isomerase/thioredoxin